MENKGQYNGEETRNTRKGADLTDKQPLLRLVQPASPSQHSSVEIDSKYLDDGRVVELIEDPADATKTKLAVYDDKKIELTDFIEYAGQYFVPFGRLIEGLADISLPGAPRPYQSVEEVFYRTHNLITSCVTLSEPYSYVTAAIVLNSWFSDRLRPPVYLLLTGLPQSGKTTLLEVLRLLCRRSLLVSDISSAAAFDVCSRFGATLLIDENDWRADPSGRALRKQLRSGTSKGLVTKHVRKTQHSYGTKILSGTDLPDDAALRSRCIHLPINETERTDLSKTWDERVITEADVIKGQLLQFRLEKFASISSRTISGAENLRPRSRDLLSSLLGPLEGLEVIEQLLLAFFLGTHDPSTRDLLSPVQSAIIAALFEFIHDSSNHGFVQVSGVAELADLILIARGERFKLNPGATSSHLTSMGFGARGRSNRGSLFPLDKSTVVKIHRLKRIHDVQWPLPEDLKVQMQNCDLCGNDIPSTSPGSP